MPDKKLNKKIFSFKRVLLGIIMILLVWWVYVAILHSVKPLPDGISYAGTEYSLKDSDVSFLYDLTYQSQNGSKIYEQNIFNEVFSIIDNAEKFIVLDMFLFNTDYASKRNFIGLTPQLKDKLIEKKKSNPQIKIYFITDEINNFYGSYESAELNELKNNGINVIITDLTKLRDSNPYYSSIWRTYIQWFGTKGSGTISHPLGRDDKNVTIRSFLKLANTKANHRKVIVADSGNSLISVVSSANPHSASSYHSNIAFLVRGEFGNEIINSERAVASFSGFEIPQLVELNNSLTSVSSGDDLKVSLLTEGKIKQSLLQDISSLQKGENLDLAMFYLSDRDIVNAILEASKREVKIRIILDPNKDAFAREKSGIPNRQVAYELVKDSSEKITIKWYDTKGEQFHTKLLILTKSDGKIIVYGGSPNYTKRNIADLNLESSLRIVSLPSTTFANEVSSYFSRLWENNGAEYTLNFESYKDSSFKKKLIYRFQEFSGFSSF